MERITQPKMESAEKEGRVDPFLGGPQMKVNGVSSHRSNGRGGNGLNNSLPPTLRKSQERFRNNPHGKNTDLFYLVNNTTGGEYNDAPQADGGLGSNSKLLVGRQGHTRNVSAGSHYSNPSDLNSSFNRNIRPMPVHERENLFNEWGAVIKHQDEIDQEMKRRQEIKMRERQKNYKMQLDEQYNEYMNKK